MASNESNTLLPGALQAPPTTRRPHRIPPPLVWAALALIGAAFFLASVLRHRPPADPLLSASAPAQTPRYTATQFLSFTINTLGGSAKNGECEGLAVDKGLCYLGDAKNITNDIVHRLGLVKWALDTIKNEKTKENPRIDERNNVLKIFMMPEFFFRGPNGAYETIDVTEGGILDDFGIRLKKYIMVEDYENYLFVFGTVITARRAKDPRLPWMRKLTKNETLYYNFAPVLKGGITDRHYIVTKKYISTADFLSRTSLPNPIDLDLRSYSQAESSFFSFAASRNTTIIQDNLLTLDNLRIGLEICLDHCMSTLYSHLKSHNLPLVDVHLITSAGMDIERGPNPVVPGGVVYLTDGGASSAACMRTDAGEFDPEVVCRGEGKVGLKYLPRGAPGGENYSAFIGLESCIEMLDKARLEGFYSIHLKQGCANTLRRYGIDVMDTYAYYPPSLEIYPTVALPVKL